MTPILQSIIDQLHAKRSGGAWSARCPAHNDTNPSLSIKQGDDGRILLHCHAGCSTESIVKALRLTMRDLFAPDGPSSTNKKPRPSWDRGARKEHMGSYQNAEKKSHRIFASAAEAVADLEARNGPKAGVWTYHNASGELVGLAVRFNGIDNDGKPTKKVLPVSRVDGGWSIVAMPEPRPLYGLTDLLKRPNELVYIVEGEKCADASTKLGFLSTTSAGGCKAVHKADWSPLADRDVVILPDRDEAGETYAATVAQILTALNPPAKVRIVHLWDAWTDLGAGGDIADVVAAGEQPDSIRAKLAKLVDAATPWTPADADAAAVADEPEPATGPVLTCLADIEAREISWLWPGRIPAGRITLLAGRPGEGKSFFTTDAAARVSTGTPWPDGGECPRGSVILISAEDDPADTIRPRLDAHHADISRIHLLSMTRRVIDGKAHEVMFTLADVATLEQAIAQVPDCTLIIVDPIGSYLGGGTDAHRDNEVRGILTPVGKLAERTGAAVLIVAHHRKSAGNHADDMALGSRAFTGIARAVWHLTRDGQNKSRRLFLPGKNNLAREGYGLAFTIAGEPPALQWERDPVQMSADDALGDDGSKPGPEPEAANQAAQWLAAELADLQEHPVADLKQAAKDAGIGWAAVRRASAKLEVISHRATFGGGYVWRLPKPAGDHAAHHAAQDPEREEPAQQEQQGDFRANMNGFGAQHVHAAQDNYSEQQGANEDAKTPAADDEGWVTA